MMPPVDRWIDLPGLRLHAREWLPEHSENSRPAFLLYHGLSSNAATWDLVASRLERQGYRVLSVNQRGHGLSDKPDDGYDFLTLVEDVRQVIESTRLSEVIIAGQSWGGNVALEFADRYPGLALGYVFVDGGFLNLRSRGNWEEVSRELRPPNLTGISLTTAREMVRARHPDWYPDGIELTLKNFQTLPDGTIRPWLTLDRHMAILRALYDQDVVGLFPRVEERVLICAAADGSEMLDAKADQVALAGKSIARSEVVWFEGTAHDIHVDRPEELVQHMLRFADQLSKKTA
jgi:pimeloyl-ACP methyl ester carboxylesterase